MAEEKNEGTEKQKPKKPKRNTSGDGMKLPVVLGVIFGIVIIFIAATYFLFIPLLIDGLGNPNAGNKTEQVEAEEGHGEKEKKAHDEDEFEDETEEELMFEKEGVHFLKTGKIMTNPKGSTKIVVIDLGLEVRVKPHAEDGEEAAEGEGHGGEFKLEEIVEAKMRSKINNIIGGMSESQLHENRDSLSVIFKHDLKPIFLKNRMYLRNVLINQFIIQ